MIVMEYYGLRIFVRLLKIPKHFLLPIIMVLCYVGAFGLNNRAFDVWSLLLFGFLGFALDKFKFPMAPVILGFILGPLAETNLRRGLMLSQQSFLPFITKPISAAFLLIAAASILYTVYKDFLKAGRKA